MSIIELVEGMVMECPMRGAENPEHVTNCGKCGEWARESMPSPRSSTEVDAPKPSSSDPISLPKNHVQRGPARLPLFSVATIIVLIGAMFFIAALALNIYYYETLSDGLPRSSDFDLWVNIGRAMIYSQLTGYIFVVLTVILLIQGSMVRQRLGTGVAGRLSIPLSHVRTLVVFALVLLVIAFGLHVFLYEVQPDLDSDLLYRLLSLFSALQYVAWICISLALFLVARRMQVGIQGQNDNLA